MPPPNPFAENTYVAWHEATFAADSSLTQKIDQLRTGLAVNGRESLEILSQILTFTANYCQVEYKLQTKTPTDYQVSLPEALRKKADAAYDLLFKSRTSIINKLWRKNSKPNPEVHLGNVQEHITDLVRTDVTATTLDSAQFMAERMNALPDIIREPKLKKAFEDAIASISFAPEMKMESGYFAYHGLVRFKNGLIVEVQIYSELMRQWRRLSHSLYELARVQGIQKQEFNSKESRLISLGHLLHLAECQLQQLAQEFGGH
jgi:ppGpp synthetase/RelA/SpoT-type nucleotidyltranferase